MYLHFLVSVFSFIAVSYIWDYYKVLRMADIDHQYKLLYFDFPGRAEHIRYMFAYAGIEYEDVRIQKDEWPGIKKTTPFGKVPVLEIDGRPIAQSNSIARYLANKFGLAGKNEWEALQCDVLVDTLGDLQTVVMQVMKETDPIKREEIRAKVTKEELPFYMSKFENIVKSNGGFSVGNDITWSDLVFAVYLDQFESMYGKASLNSYPALKGLKEKVHNIPNIRKYLENRPPRSPMPR